MCPSTMIAPLPAFSGRAKAAIIFFACAISASLGVVERVEILPFHQLGKYKWQKLGLEYRLALAETPSNEVISQAVGIFRAAGLKAS